MTNEKFDSHDFSIHTEIKVDGEWERVIDVDFVDRKINGHEIEKIEEINN